VGVRAWLNSFGSRKGLSTGFCEHGNGLSCHIKCNFFEQLNNCWFLNKIVVVCR